jgi:hypothetical protein
MRFDAKAHEFAKQLYETSTQVVIHTKKDLARKLSERLRACLGLRSLVRHDPEGKFADGPSTFDRQATTRVLAKRHT